MNKPEYIFTDEMAIVVEAARVQLNTEEPGLWPVLNYQYGYVEELNETLKQFEDDPSKFDKKFPLVWVAEPFVTTRGDASIFGVVEPDIFIIHTTDKNWKAAERMTNNYKPVLFPIYRQLLTEIVKSVVFSHQSPEAIPHKVTKGYYWGEAQKTVLNDAVDCLKISALKLRINHNHNCTPFKSFQ